MNGGETPPPPVHVHVSEATPIHVHMKKSPSRKQQIPEAQNKDGGRAKGRAPPWIPPGKTPTRREGTSYSCQRSRAQCRSESDVKERRDAEEEEQGMTPVSKNLAVLLKEEETNRRHLKKSDSGAQVRDTDELLRALVETDIDGAAVTNQLAALKEMVDGLSTVKRLTKMHMVSLGRQRDLLLEKIEMFASTNHSLRSLLREWTEQEKESLLWSEQKDALKKRLTNSEAENIRLLAKLTNKEREAYKLSEHLDLEKESNKTSEELSRLLETTRSHLESQLHRAQTENTELTGQIERMQQTQDELHLALRSLQDELRIVTRLRDEEEQERRELEVDRAERAEEETRKLTDKLHDKEAQLAQALSTSSEWCVRHSNEAAAKEKMEQEISALKLHVTELTAQLHSAGERSRKERDELRDRLQHMSEQNSAVKLENHKLKDELVISEDRLRALQSEARQLKTSLKKHENQLDKYKKKLCGCRLESEQFCLKLEATEKRSRELKVELSLEKEEMRRQLQSRLRELETLPEKLRRTEQQLRDAQRNAETYERRNSEHNTALAQVRLKVEQQGAQLDLVQQRNTLLQDENNSFQKKIQTLQRKLEELKTESRSQSQALALKESLVHKLEQQFEEKTLEVSVLSTRLQHSVDDANKQVDEGMQRLLAKERVSQSKALELQSELSRAKTELNLLQRSKHEMERRFLSQLQNMKERLEQSDSTNRTLQNYVQFLKTSYGNVFGESLMTSQ